MMVSVPPRSGRSVVVTNAGAGLGRDIALGLAARKYMVFGTAMSAAEAREIKNASGGRVSLTACDLTETVAVEAWACGVSDALGHAGLDLLINNGGLLAQGPIELLELGDIRHEFEVNVFGTISVTNAFLPALRKSPGRIVQVSTWLASVPLPFGGASGASQAAIEVFSAVYRAELKPFGIEVLVAATGDINGAATAAALTRKANAMTPQQRKLYGKSLDVVAKKMRGVQPNESSSAVAARIIELAEQYPAPSRSAIG